VTLLAFHTVIDTAELDKVGLARGLYCGVVGQANEVLALLNFTDWFHFRRSLVTTGFLLGF